MSVIDAEEFARRRKQKKIDKEQTEDDIYQEKVADLVEHMLINAVAHVKQDDILLEHFLMEVWMQSNFIALRFFQDKTFNELLVEKFGDCDGLIGDQDENERLKLAKHCVSKLQTLCLEGAIESITYWSGGK